MRRAITYCGIGLLASCLFVFAARWTVAQDAEPTDDVAAVAEQERSEPTDVERYYREDADFDDAEYDEPERHEADDDEWEDEDDEWEEEDEHDAEETLFEFEVHAAECEHARRLADIASSRLETASWVIANIHEFLGEEEAADFLQQLFEAAEDPGIKRLIGLKLTEIYAELDQADQVKAQLRSLILGS